MGPGSAPNARRNVRTIVVAILLASSAATVGIGLTAAGAASATPTGVDECTTIDETGSYELTTDLGTGPEVSTTCIRITASDVTFDGNGHTVGAPDALPNDTFLVADGPGELRNVTLRDVRIRGDAPTVRFGNVTGARIANVSVTSTDRERPYTPGRIRVTGDGNTITGTTGFVSLSVIGDDNRVVDAETSGNYERRSLSVDGDRNLVGNLSVTGGTAVVSGADNRVANSALGFIAGRGGLRFENATDPVLINSSATGVDLEHTTGASIRDNDVDPASGPGSGWITLEDSDDNELVNNDITGDFFSLQLTDDSDENVVHGNTMGGVTVEGSESNLIYDNRIRASERSDGLDTIIIGSDAGPNTWNVTPRPGENVIGGDTVAGNVYVNAEGTGFSQMCANADGDGLCDSPKEMGPNNADHAALSDPVESLAAIGDNELPTDPDGDGRYEDVDGEDGFTYADVVVLFGNLDDPAVRNYADAYDFDGAGGVTYSDVIALFWETFESPHG